MGESGLHPFEVTGTEGVYGLVMTACVLLGPRCRLFLFPFFLQGLGSSYSLFAAGFRVHYFRGAGGGGGGRINQKQS